MTITCTASLSRSATGNLYGLDDFSTSPYDVYTVGWTAEGTVAIEAGELSCAASGGGSYTGATSKASYSGSLVSGGKITSSAGRPYILWHQAAGNYNVFFAATGASVTVSLRCVSTVLATATVACVLGVTYLWKVVHIGSSIKFYWGGTLILSATDATYTSGTVRLRGYHATVNTAHFHWDNIYIANSNVITVTNLPTGWDVTCGGVTAHESGGTATLDMAGVAFPITSITIRDASDAEKATLSPTGPVGVWGGDTYPASVSYTVELPVGEATAEGLPPTMSSGCTVDLPVGEAVAEGLTPTYSVGCTVDLPVGEATAEGLEPTYSVGCTVSLPVAEALAEGLEPTFSVGCQVDLPIGEAVAEGLPIEFSVGCTVSLPIAEAVASGLAPFIYILPAPGTKITVTVGASRTVATIGDSRTVATIGASKTVATIGPSRTVATIGDSKTVATITDPGEAD